MKRLVIDISDGLYKKINILAKKIGIKNNTAPKSIEDTFKDMVEFDAITNWYWDVRDIEL